MLEQGLLKKCVRSMRVVTLHPDMPSIAAGYRQVWDYLAGKYDYAEMTERGIIATRQLAKRQITWLRSWLELYWLDSKDANLFSIRLENPPKPHHI